MKYGMKDVFDVLFFDNATGKVLFNIDISCSFKCERRINRSFITITDAVIDVDVINNIMLGTYHDVDFKLVGKSQVREIETCIDREFALYVPSAKIHKFEFGVDMHEMANPRLVFEIYPSKDELYKLFRVVDEG